MIRRHRRQPLYAQKEKMETGQLRLPFDSARPVAVKFPRLRRPIINPQNYSARARK